MQLNTSKIVLAVIVTAIIVGGGVYYWQSSKQAEPNIVAQPTETQAAMETYSSNKYSFKYPKGYSVTETGKENTYILTVSKSTTTKLEIFKASEYPGDRAAFGFTGEETPAEAEAYMKEVNARSPKEYLTVGDYDVWLYYGENDSQAKNELKTIFDSIVVK